MTAGQKSKIEIATIVAVICSLLSLAYTYGVQSGQINDNAEDINRLEKRQREDVQAIESRIAQIQGAQQHIRLEIKGDINSLEKKLLDVFERIERKVDQK